MEANLKAKELFEKFWSEGLSDSQAKQCSIFAVEEIRSDYASYRVKHYLTLKHALELKKYWDDVLYFLNAL